MKALLGEVRGVAEVIDVTRHEEGKAPYYWRGEGGGMGNEEH